MDANPNGTRPTETVAPPLNGVSRDSVRLVDTPVPAVTTAGSRSVRAASVLDHAPDTAQRLMYQELFDFAPDAYLLTDTTGVVRAANHAAARLLRVHREFLLDKPLSCFIAQGDWPVYYDRLIRLRMGSVDQFGDWPLRVRESRGEAYGITAHVCPFSDGGGPVRVLRWVLVSAQADEDARLVLRRDRDFVDAVLEADQSLVVVIAPLGNILRAGATLCTLLDRAEKDLFSSDWRRLFPERERDRLHELMLHTMASKVPQHTVAPLVLPDGTWRTVRWGFKRLELERGTAVLAVGHDLTDLEAAQAQALQSARLAAIGHVTAALAHEARNMLQRMQSGLDRLSWRLQDRPEALEIVGRVQAAQRDMTLLFDDVRTYAAPLKLDFASHDLREVWREAWQQALGGCADRDCELLEHTVGTNLYCVVDRFRVVQVFRNILENAIAAAPDPVIVTVTGQTVQLGEDLPAVKLAFGDNGPGLGEEQRRQIFEPFYSTKPRGTGLGMAIAKRIVEAHGGSIAVGSPRAGAEIIVTFPRSPAP
jgi:signal transduction histidine kinase